MIVDRNERLVKDQFGTIQNLQRFPFVKQEYGRALGLMVFWQGSKAVSTAGSWEKDTENGATGFFFGPSFFVTALGM